MIATTVCLGNVRDIEGLVAHTIRRSRIRLSREEHEELLAEGIAIVCDLWSRFVPHRDGYEHAGTFSGYVGSLLPKRLDDAYHKLHPEHRASRDEGVRFEYGHAPMSLDADGMGELAATMSLGPSPYDRLPDCPTVALASMAYDPPAFIASAVARLPAEFRIAQPARIVGYIEQGLGVDEIARNLRMDRAQVGRVRSGIEAAVRIQIAEQGTT